MTDNLTEQHEIELWKETPINPIFDFSLHVSNLGNVKRVYFGSGEEKPIKLTFDLKTNRIDINKVYFDESGEKKKVSYKKTIHKLVAQLFVSNPDQLIDVIHVDKNMANNHFKNLLWVTRNKFKVYHSNYLIKRPAEKLKFYGSEKFADFYTDSILNRKYAVSNFGRIVIYTTTLAEGFFMPFNYKFTITPPYLLLKPETKKGEKKAAHIYHLVAIYFLPTKKEDQDYIIHLDHNPENNHYANLQWSSKVEKSRHTKMSPRVRAAKGDLMQKGTKLTKTQVILIKRLIAKGKLRNKMIAKQFGISEMSVYRIKRGEAWAHVKLENE